MSCPYTYVWLGLQSTLSCGAPHNSGFEDLRILLCSAANGRYLSLFFDGVGVLVGAGSGRRLFQKAPEQAADEAGAAEVDDVDPATGKARRTAESFARNHLARVVQWCGPTRASAQRVYDSSMDQRYFARGRSRVGIDRCAGVLVRRLPTGRAVTPSDNTDWLTHRALCSLQTMRFGICAPSFIFGRTSVCQAE